MVSLAVKGCAVSKLEDRFEQLDKVVTNTLYSAYTEPVIHQYCVVEYDPCCTRGFWGALWSGCVVSGGF